MDKRDLLNLPKIDNLQELNSLLLFSDKQLDKFVLFKDKDKVSDRLAKLCTFCKELPQGGICSPGLSNLACLELDNDLMQYCDERDIRYTRYADDLIFSSNEESSLKFLLRDIRQELFFTIIKNKKDYNQLIGQIAFVLSIENAYGNYIKKYADLVCQKNNIQHHPIINTLNKMIK